jgi:photosystem II stability/assembly factor-like uncharacterized protein
MKKLFYFLSLALAIQFIHGNKIFADGFNSVHSSDGVNVIAAGDAGKIFRSFNGGNTWSSYTEPSVNFKSVYTKGTSAWISSDNGNVYKSATTSTIMSPYNVGVSTSINSVFFLDEVYGFVCGDNGVIYKSVNGGIAWTPINSGIGSDKLNAIYFKDMQNGIVVGNNGKVYMTADGGSSWTPETISTSRNLLDAGYYSDGIVIVGEWGTLFTKPNGQGWTQVATRINTDIRGVTGSSISDIHVCGGGGFIRNNQSNSPLFLNFEKNPMLANLVDIVYVNSNLGFAVSSLNNAIIRTTNGGTSWENPPGTTVSYSWALKPGASGNFLGNNLCLHPTDRNVVFIAFGNQVYRSGDKGDDWAAIGNSIPSGTTPHSFFVNPLDTNIWLVATESSPDKIYRTSNYGQSWNVVLSMNFSSYGQPLEMDQNNPRTFYFAPDNGGFYKSTDEGATFSEISNNYPFRSPCDILVMWDNPNTIFLADGITGSGLATLFKSVNGGVNWTLVHTNTSSSEIPSMCNTVFDQSTIWCTEWSGNNIYRSTDYGDSWSLHHSNSFSGWGSDICHEDPTLMVTGSWSSRATMTVNAGANWTDISSGLNGHGGGIIIPERGYILCHQGNNVYKLDVSYSVLTSVSENIISSVPKDFNLSQNYPNPFNPSTKINYDLPKSGNVVLKVYNELGKEVNTLVSSYKNAGSYEITFDATNLSSGIYFYKLESDGLTATKKMLLVK